MSKSEDSKLVNLALLILSEPEVSRDEMKVRVREYLRKLSPEEYQRLEQEALNDDQDERVERIEILRALGFTDKEIYAYSRCRLNTPGMRKVIARRALLAKGLQRGADILRQGSFMQLVRLEDSLIGNMDTEDMIRELR